MLVTGGITAVAPASPAGASPLTLYVSTTGTNTSNNCQTSSKPCATVSYAVSQAASGDTIQVAAGTYQDIVAIAPPLTNITIEGAGDASTTIDGLSTSAQIGSVFAIEGDSNATIENLTIANGEGVLFTSENVSTTYGNGVFVSLSGSATLSNDTITGNTDTRGQVVDDGGAVYNGGTLTMTDDTVSNNGGTAGMYDGGGIFTAARHLDDADGRYIFGQRGFGCRWRYLQRRFDDLERRHPLGELGRVHGAREQCGRRRVQRQRDSEFERRHSRQERIRHRQCRVLKQRHDHESGRNDPQWRSRFRMLNHEWIDLERRRAQLE